MITEHECPTCEGANNFSFNACHQFQFQSNNDTSGKFLKVCNPHFCAPELEESCSPLSIAYSRGRRSSEESSATTLRKYYDGTASTTPTSVASPTVPFDALKATDKYVSKVQVRLQSKTPQPKFPERQASTDFDTDSGRSSATESLSDADTYLAWPARLISDNQLEVYGGSPSIRVDCIKTESIPPPPPLSESHVDLPSACPSPPELPLTTPSEFSTLKQTAYFKRNENEEAKSFHSGCSAHEYCENSRLNKSESPNVEVEPFSTPSPKSKSCSQASSLKLPPSIFAEGAYPPSVKGHVKRFVSMLEVKISSSDSQTRRSESTGTGYSKFSLARRMNAFAVTSKIRLYSSRCELISPLNDSGSQTINHSGSNSIKSHDQTTALSVEGKPQKSTSQKASALISALTTPENKKVERNGTPDRNDSNGTPTLGQSMRLRRMRPQQELTEIRTVKSSQGFDRHPVTADSGNCGVINPVCTDRISKAGHNILLQSSDSRCSKQSVKVNLQSGSPCSQIPVSLLKLGMQKTDNTVRSFAQMYIADTEPEDFTKVRSPTTMEHHVHLPKFTSRPLSPKVLEPHEISFGEKSGSGQLLHSQKSPPTLDASTPATQMSLVNNAQTSEISKESAMPQGKQSLPSTQCSISYLSQNLPVVNPALRTHDDLQLHSEEVQEHRILLQKDTHSSVPLINERLAEPAILAADVWSARNNRSLLFNSRHSSENVSPVKTEQHFLINKFLGIGNSTIGDFSSSAIEYRLLDVPPKVSGGTSVRLALPLAGLHGQLSSKEGEIPLTLTPDCASSPNQMTKMFVGSLQLVREVHGTLPLEIAGLSLLPNWHGDGDGILSTYQLPPRRYSLRVSGGRASRLRKPKNLFQTSYEKPIPTPDVETTSLSNAPQRDSSPVRATVGVTKGAVSENRCRWAAIPNMRRGSHVFMSDLWPEIIQRRDREGNPASSLQGYSCKLFSLETEKQEGSERLPGLKATGSLPAMQRQFMLETTAIVDSTLTPETTESVYLMPMRVGTPPKDIFSADVGEKKSIVGDYRGTCDSRQPRSQVKWAAYTGQNLDEDEYDGASSYYVVEDAKVRRSSSATLADSGYQSCFPKGLDCGRGRSQSLQQRRKSCLSQRIKNASEMSLLESLRSKETELRELLERCKNLKTEIKKTSKLCRQHKTHLTGRPDIDYSGLTEDDCLDTLSLHSPRSYYTKKLSNRHHRHCKHSSEHRSGHQPSNYLSPKPQISSIRFQNQYDPHLKTCLLSSPSSLGVPSAYPLSTSPIYNQFPATSPGPIIMPPTYTAQVHMPLPAFAHSDPRFAAYGGGGYGAFGMAGIGGAGEYLRQSSGTMRPQPMSDYWPPGMPPPFGYARHRNRCCFSRHGSRSGSYRHRSKSSRHVSLRHRKSSHSHHHRRRSESEGPSLRKSRDRQEKFRDNDLYRNNYQVPFSGDTGSPSFHGIGLAPKEREKTSPVALPTDFSYTSMGGDSTLKPCNPPSGDSLLPQGTYNLSAIGISNPFKGHSIPNESTSLSFIQSPSAPSLSATQAKPIVQAPPMHYLRPNEQAPNFAMQPTMAGRVPVSYRPIQGMNPRPMNDSGPPPPPQKPYQQLQPQPQMSTQGSLNSTLQQLPIKTLPARRMANPNAQPRPHLSAMFNSVGRPQPPPPPLPPPQQQIDGLQSIQSASMMNQAPSSGQPSVPDVGTTGPPFGLYRLPANKGEYIQLEKRYDWLQQEKSRLETDLSKLPLRGKGSNRGSISMEEDRLTLNLKRIDREISALRLIMKKYQSNLASQRMELSKTKLL